MLSSDLPVITAFRIIRVFMADEPNLPGSSDHLTSLSGMNRCFRLLSRCIRTPSSSTRTQSRVSSRDSESLNFSTMIFLNLGAMPVTFSLSSLRSLKPSISRRVSLSILPSTEIRSRHLRAEFCCKLLVKIRSREGAEWNFGSISARRADANLLLWWRDSCSSSAKPTWRLSGECFAGASSGGLGLVPMITVAPESTSRWLRMFLPLAAHNR